MAIIPNPMISFYWLNGSHQDYSLLLGLRGVYFEVATSTIVFRGIVLERHTKFIHIDIYIYVKRFG